MSRADPKKLPRPVNSGLSVEEIDNLLVAWIKGEEISIVSDFSKADCEAILLRIDFHGVVGLIDPLSVSKDRLTDALRQGIRGRIIAWEVWERDHKQTLCSVLEALSNVGIEPLIIKGTGLAYRNYDRPTERPRGDTDLLVAPDDFDRASRVFLDMGARAWAMPAGPVGGCARLFLFPGRFGLGHQIDLHFGISAHPALSGLLKYEGLSEVAIELPSLSPQARTIRDEHALILASMHRLKHRHSAYYAGGVQYRSPDRLIWLYDIHVLSGQLTKVGWKRLLAAAQTAGLSGAVALALEAATKAYATEYPPQVMGVLQQRGKAERPTRFLTSGVLSQTVMDFAALPNIRSKTLFLREVCFPSSEHMRSAFADVRPQFLPWLYIYRAARGARVFWRGNWGQGQK